MYWDICILVEEEPEFFYEEAENHISDFQGCPIIELASIEVALAKHGVDFEKERMKGFLNAEGEIDGAYRMFMDLVDEGKVDIMDYAYRPSTTSQI